MRLGALLYIYKGEWGLPSIDFECLRALCLVKFTRFPVQIETNSNPYNSGAGKLPYLEIGNEKFVGYDQIKKLLDKEGYPIDAKLNAEEKRLSESFSLWVFSSLQAYYYYTIFGEPNNFEITRSLYAKRTPFPFNFYYPSVHQREAYDIVYVMGGFDLDDSFEHYGDVYLETIAKKCINTLSKRLGRNVWFFGDQFSELDAIVFSYLSVLSKILLPKNPVYIHVNNCKNLVNFINRIARDVFKHESFDSENTNKDDASPDNHKLTPTERKFLQSEKKTKLLSGIAAVVAMSSFAAIQFFFKKKFSSPLEYYNGLHYDDDDNLEGDVD